MGYRQPDGRYIGGFIRVVPQQFGRRDGIESGKVPTGRTALHFRRSLHPLRAAVRRRQRLFRWRRRNRLRRRRVRVDTRPHPRATNVTLHYLRHVTPCHYNVTFLRYPSGEPYGKEIDCRVELIQSNTLVQ